MRCIDRLPELRPSVAGEQFLDQMKEAALNLPGYGIEAEGDLFSGGKALKLAAVSEDGEISVICLFSLHGHRCVRIQLADANSNTPFPEYLAQVKSALFPILKSYRRRFSEKVQFYVPPSPLSNRNGSGARRVFDSFVVVADEYLAPSINSIDSIAWGYFYEFVIYCHDKRVKLAQEELREILRDAGFSQSVADELAGAYEHGREILGRQREARWSSAWARVIAKRGRVDV